MKLKTIMNKESSKCQYFLQDNTVSENKKSYLPFYPTETKVATQIKTALTQSYTDKSFMC